MTEKTAKLHPAKKKVLVVDDDTGTLHLMKSLLESNGFRAYTLETSTFTMKTIKREGPDLVILDILMPGKDGYKVCQEIKALYANKIPVILMTAQNYEKDLISEAYKDFGADDFLIKPIQSNEFLEKIRKLFK